MFSKVKSFFFPVICLAILIPTILPLLKPGFFQSDDGDWMIIRSSDFHRSLRDGQLPVRWAGRLNNEYGYPIFNFHYPLPFYLNEIPKAAGFNFVESTKITFGASLILSFLFCFLWLKSAFDKKSAFLGALVYLYAPFHLYDVYRRGSLGEAVGFVFLPIALYSIHKKKFLLTSISISLLLLSHNTFALISLPLIIIYMITLFSRDINTLRTFLTSFLLGIGLSAFFIFPAILELKYTVFRQTQISDFSSFFLKADKLFLTNSNTPSFGPVAFFIILLSGFTVSAKKMNLTPRDKLSRIFLLVLTVTIVLVLPSSWFIWKTTGLYNLLQFPWRLLSLSIVCLSFLAAYFFSHLFTLITTKGEDSSLKPWFFRFLNKSSVQYAFFGLITALIILPSTKDLYPKEFSDKSESFYTTNESTTTTKDEFLPIWVREKPKGKPDAKVEIMEGRGVIEALTSSSNRVNFLTNLQEKSEIRVNTVYFPGWKVIRNGEETKINYENDRGTINFQLPSGSSKVEVKLTRTPVRLISETISLISLVLLLWVPTSKNLKQKKISRPKI